MAGAIELEGSQNSSSPSLQYVSQSVINPTQNLTSATNVIPFLAAANTWYAFEYEMAYDPNMAAKTFLQLSYRLNIQGINISNMNLAGTSNGTLTGTLSSPGNSLTINPNFSSPSTNYINSVIINGESDSNKLGIATAIKNGIKSGLTSGLSGLVKGFLSGLFSKTSTSSNVSKMMIDMNMNFTGTIQSQFGITSPSVPFTGTQTSVGGNTYGGVPGVFRLTQKPTIKITKIHQRKLNEFGQEIVPDIFYSYEVVNSTVNIQYNPAVVPGLGTVNNVKSEVVIPSDGIQVLNGTIEKSGTVNIATGFLVKNSVSQVDPIGVRVSFRFQPSNGSPYVLNVKTFSYNIDYVEVYLPPVGGGGGEETI